MITCEKCRTEFMADYTQPYPGHTDPPGAHIAYAIIFGLIGTVSVCTGIFVFRTLLFAIGFSCLIGALMSFFRISEARAVCERTGGGVCPCCGHQNPVRWYS